MGVRTIIALLHALSLATVVRSACKLPPQENINWAELKGEWYEQTVHGSTTSRCDVITSIDSTAYGSNIWLTSISTSGKTENSLTISLNSGKDPYQAVYFPYHPINGSAIPLQQALSITVRGVPIVADAARLHPLGYYTDYNYFITLGCDPQGQKLVFVFGKNREPTAADIMNTRKLLIDIGHGWEDVLLEFSPCLSVLEK